MPSRAFLTHGRQPNLYTIRNDTRTDDIIDTRSASTVVVARGRASIQKTNASSISAISALVLDIRTPRYDDNARVEEAFQASIVVAIVFPGRHFVCPGLR